MAGFKKWKRITLFPVLISMGWLFPSIAFSYDRIVSLNPMLSEWTAELLGREKSLKTMVGVSEYSHYPEYLKTIPSVGPYPQVRVEQVASLRPDLVLVSTEYNRPEQIEQLKRLKLKVEVLPKEDFSSMDRWILKLGKVLGHESEALRASKLWNEELRALKAPPKKEKAFFQIQFQPLITAGKTSFIQEAFRLVGYENVFGEIAQAYPKVSREAVYAKKPAVVFVFEMVKDQNDLEKMKSAWKGIPVKILNGDDFSRCSPRLLSALKGVIPHESK